MRFGDLDIERAMVIYAHADDAEYEVAGTAAAWARQGVEVTYVMVTNGASGSSDPEMTRERLAGIRLAEQQEAAAVLGVKEVVPLGFEDGYLYPDLELRKAVAREIRRFRPDVVFGPDPTTRTAFDIYVNHPDHIAVGEVVFRSVNPDASSGLMFPELWRDEGFEPWLPKALFVMSLSSGTTPVDITETMDLKIEALMCHRSQHKDPEGTTKWVHDFFGAAGKKHGFGYAEAFKIIRLGLM
jgi:LmbE family N-acetylglucosaminyl deacetylase